MTTPEAGLVLQCKQAADALNCFLAVVGQRNAKRSGSTIGFPDAVVFCAGHVKFVEFKDAKTGKLSLGQSCFLARAAEQGVEVHVVDNVDDFVRLVNSCRRGVGVTARK